MPSSSDERERWNQKYRDAPDAWLDPDPFLLSAYSEYIRPSFPDGGAALDLAGGAGRHSIWLAKQGWDVTLIDISETGVQQARRNAGALASQIRFVIDDLNGFAVSHAQFDVVMAFFYLDRQIFPEIMKAIRPGGLLLYKTLTMAQLELPGGPKDPAHLLADHELLRLADGLEVLHYREQITKKATAELVARKDDTLTNQQDRA